MLHQLLFWLCDVFRNEAFYLISCNAHKHHLRAVDREILHLVVLDWLIPELCGQDLYISHRSAEG